MTRPTYLPAMTSWWGPRKEIGVMKIDVWRSRWAAAGAALAITFCGGGLLAAHAMGSPSDASVLVPQAPVRVLDTREAASPIHALGQGSVATLSLATQVPAEATAAEINLTVVNGTTGSFLTLYPTGTVRPLASAINWADNVAQANSTVIKLGANKSFNIYNNSGSVDVVIDLVGYYVPSAGGGGANGAQGPAGAGGAKGDKGDTGAAGAAGAAGAKGDTGATGPAGNDGADGIDGSNGVDGMNGLDGSNGIDGVNGVDGLNGDQGLPGADGTNGLDGGPGADGLPGAKGDTGYKGDTGLTGPAGAAG